VLHDRGAMRVGSLVRMLISPVVSVNRAPDYQSTFVRLPRTVCVLRWDDDRRAVHDEARATQLLAGAAGQEESSHEWRDVCTLPI